jgi:hypothetical protein
LTLYEPTAFDFYIDATAARPVIGLTITSANGSVTVPMSSCTAHDIGGLLIAHADHLRAQQ